MKPFTLEWWLDVKEHARSSWIDVDDITDECSMDGSKVDKDFCELCWEQWHRGRRLEGYIRKRILNKYGE